MSIRASNLKVSLANDNKLQQHVREILSMIDDKIKDASANHQKLVEVNLPISFAIPAQVSNKDVQRAVYYLVLKNLVDREFEVEIELRNTVTLLNVTWYTQAELEDIDQQTQFLASKTKKKN